MSRKEDGTALVEFIWLAVILLVPLLYVVTTVFDVQRTAYAASAAARSASRAYVAGADQQAAQRAAQVAAALAFADQGLADAEFTLRIRCTPDPDQCLTPGSVVTAVIGASRALPLMPALFGGTAPAVSVEAEHRSPYGTFREARE